MPKPTPTVPWANGFQPPSRDEIAASVGTFPCAFDQRGRRQALLVQEDNNKQTTVAAASLEQVDMPQLYQPKQVFALPRPRDPQDWLACCAEYRDPFDAYVAGLTMGK